MDFGSSLRFIGISALVAGLLAIIISFFYGISAFDAFGVLFPLVAIVYYSFLVAKRKRDRY